VTRRKAMAIGSRLALGHGVSRGIALLRSRRAALDVAMGRYAATAAVLARLGKELFSISMAAAPVRAFRPLKSPHAAVYLPGGVVHRAITPHVTDAMAVTASKPAQSLNRDRIRSSDSLRGNRTTRRHTSGLPVPPMAPRPARTAESGEPLGAVPAVSDRTHQARSTRPATGSTRAWTPVLPQAYALSRLPAEGPSSPSITADTPVDNVLPRQPTSGADAPIFDDTPSASTTPIAMASMANPNPLANQRSRFDTQQSYDDMRALERFSVAPIGTTVSRNDGAANRATSNLMAPSHLGRNPQSAISRGMSSAGNQSQSAESDQEPQRGTIVLDGAELGRWVIGYLETQALRPGRMTTGIDPRMNATFPGAPTGV